jgi:hypothetical protein
MMLAEAMALCVLASSTRPLTVHSESACAHEHRLHAKKVIVNSQCFPVSFIQSSSYVINSDETKRGKYNHEGQFLYFINNAHKRKRQFSLDF